MANIHSPAIQAPLASSSTLPGSTAPVTTLGAKHYGLIALRLYDLWVLKLSSSFAWKCSTSSILQPFFTANFSNQHMDVGVGTGYFPAAALGVHERGLNQEESPWSVTLVDLNMQSLETARTRIGIPESTRCVLADALSPLPPDVQQFDSISIFYLLHCLPGPPKHKTTIFENLKLHLNEGGVLFGATVLGKDVQHNLFGKLLMLFYNATGIFDNRLDGEQDFVDALNRNFARVESKVVGRVLLFRAWEPIRL